MTKIYAIVQPAYTLVGGDLADIPYLIVMPYHKVMYERVCGYSLGHQVEFFYDLEDAKDGFREAVAHNPSFFSHRIRQNAIVELEWDQGEILSFCKIYTVDKVKMAQIPCYTKQDREVPKLHIPVWKEQDVTAKDVTANALSEINRQFHNRNVDASPQVIKARR